MKSIHRKTIRAVERLESRQMMATFGVPWQDPRHLTLSFAPDGTTIGGHTSDLFSTLDAQKTRAVWQKDVLRAFATWASKANLDVGVMNDSGLALGTFGKQQDDGRFGDIRIAAHGMSPESLSVSVPHDPFLAGTLAGDVLVNSNINFGAGGTNLFAVMLHEAGHVLGLDHNPNPLSVMYSHTAANRVQLSAQDIAAVQALYGVRSPDLNEAKKSNDTLDGATRIKFSESSDGYNGSTPLLSFGDITTASDVDYFYLRPLTGYTGPVTFRLQSQGLSLLATKLTVTDSLGNVIGRAMATKPEGNLVTVKLRAMDPTQTYYVRVEGATTDVFGIGRYGLAVTFDQRLTVPPADIDAALRSRLESLRSDDVDEVFSNPNGAIFNDDLHTDDTIALAVGLKPTPGYPTPTHFEYVGSISDATDRDFYRMKAPNNTTVNTWYLTATVTVQDYNGVLPKLTLVNSVGVQVPFTTLVNGNGQTTIQSTAVAKGDPVFIRVANNGAAGNYSLVGEFSSQPAQLNTLATQTLNAALNRVDGTLYVGQDQLFQFLLTANPLGSRPQQRTRMQVVNAAGRVVFDLTAKQGETVSGSSVFLLPGTYRLRFFLESPNGQTLLPMGFRLQGASLTSPVGPAVEDPTFRPKFVCPTDRTKFCYPVGTGIITPSPFFFFLPPR